MPIDFARSLPLHLNTAQLLFYFPSDCAFRLLNTKSQLGSFNEFLLRTRPPLHSGWFKSFGNQRENILSGVVTKLAHAVARDNTTAETGQWQSLGIKMNGTECYIFSLLGQLIRKLIQISTTDNELILEPRWVFTWHILKLLTKQSWLYIFYHYTPSPNPATRFLTFPQATFY